MMNDCFIVALNGLKAGRSDFEWHADGKFFGEFENSEILDADLNISTSVEKSGRYIGVDCFVSGTVVVSCDRCLADLTLPVDTVIKLSVKFGEGNSVAAEGERETLMLPESDTDLDMRQIIYDYVCTSLPVQRVHGDGDCDEDVVRYLSVEDDADGKMAPKDQDMEGPLESPFASLRNLLEKE